MIPRKARCEQPDHTFHELGECRHAIFHENSSNSAIMSNIWQEVDRYAGKRVEKQAIDESRKYDGGNYSYRVREIKQSSVPCIGNCYREHFAGEFNEERGPIYTPERRSVKACLRMRGFGLFIPKLWGTTLVTR